MKGLKTILGIALSTATLGGAIAVGAVSLDSNKMNKTEAATNGRFTILIDDDSWWKNDYAQIWATYSSAGEIRITPDPDLGTVENDGFTWHDFGSSGWYAVLTMEVDTSTFTYGNFYFQRKNPADGADWGNSGWTLSPSAVKNGTCNTVRIASDNSFYQDWGNYWKITTYHGVSNYSNLSSATKSCYLKSAGYSFSETPAPLADGSEFVGWYTDTALTKSWDGSFSSDMTVYAKYASTTARFVDSTGADSDFMEYNSANNQWEGIRYFSANEKFKVKKTVGSTPTLYSALDSSLPTSVATSDGTWVTVKSAGTYAVYFKGDNTMWIQTASATLEAYMYAGYFLTNIGCDANGVNAPTGWSDCATRYGTLSPDAKNLIYNFNTASAEEGDDIADMIERYEWAINHNPNTLSHFIVNGSGAERPISGSRIVNPVSIDTNNSMIIIITIASIITLAAVGGYFIIRRRKHN